MNAPLIIDIEGNSQDDGPGIRSVVFFKGCPLSCLWCQNPESQNRRAELWWDRDKCISDGACQRVCLPGAISRDNLFFIDRSKCTLCFKCVAVCPSKALRRVGREMSVDEIVNEVVRFKPYFDTSGGGVTLSGGDPTLHLSFTSNLLARFKAEGVHTLLETAGWFDLEQFESLILPYVDQIYFDIKFIDSSEHERYCGVKNELILSNFISLHEKSSSGGFGILPRTPLIPGITDTEKNIHEIAAFYDRCCVRRAVFLPNNPAWTAKLDKLGRQAQFDRESPIRKLYDGDREKRIGEYFVEHEIDVNFG